ncbi:MAG TPA: hypothetical protein VF346_10255 [Bacteroidales bacterium]
MYIPNLLLIAGTGTKSGKTTMACKVIEQFDELNITAIKITPHFHETSPGLKKIYEEKGFIIYEETDPESAKDTSRMLRSGASKVYFAKVFDDRLLFVFNKIKDLIPKGTPIVCESPALRNFIEPGVFIIMSSETTRTRKDISQYLAFPHLYFEYEKLLEISSIPIGFENGGWHYV